MTLRLDRAALLNELRATCFDPAGAIGGGAPRIGLEAEYLVVDAVTRRPFPIESSPTEGSAPVLRRLATRQRWTSRLSAKDVPEFHLADGGRITFEPGGQIEYSSPAMRSLSDVVRTTQGVLAMLRPVLADAGAELLARGVDPDTRIEDAPLQLPAERYVRMDRYFADIGPSGARMMRQTAALQVSLDFGAHANARWRMLNALAPVLAAVFANSSRYAGAQTGWMSWRRHIWDTLDPLRTGVQRDATDPAHAYLDFALAAPAILLPNGERRCAPFQRWLETGCVSRGDWHAHLSTLFPEVRPRGYLEVRTLDAVSPEWLAAPLVFLTGLVYAPASFAAAADLLGPADPEALARSGELGLRDHAMAQRARDLWDIAIAGAKSLGSSFIAPAELDVAGDYAARYTMAGLCPADDHAEAAAPVHA